MNHTAGVFLFLIIKDVTIGGLDVRVTEEVADNLYRNTVVEHFGRDSSSDIMCRFHINSSSFAAFSNSVVYGPDIGSAIFITENKLTVIAIGFVDDLDLGKNPFFIITNRKESVSVWRFLFGVFYNLTVSAFATFFVLGFHSVNMNLFSGLVNVFPFECT